MLKKEFIAKVEAEVKALKKHATPAEIDKLDRELVDYSHINNCIYGLMTGSCESPRARVLLDQCAQVSVHSRSEDGSEGRGSEALEDFVFNNTFSSFKHLITEEYKEDIVDQDSEEGDFERTYVYISGVETYIGMKDAKVSHLVRYLRGLDKELKL